MVEQPAPTRWVRKHEGILEAATTLFLRKGYLGTSMDDIAREAAVSKQTVYQHFADKEQLFAAIVLATTDRVEDLVRLTGDALATSSDLQADLGQLACRFLTTLMQPELLRLRRLVIATADHFPEVGRSWYEQGFERVLAALAERFAQLSDRGLLAVEDPPIAAHHFVGLVLWIPVNRAMFTGDETSHTKEQLDAYAKAAVQAFLRSYGRPGRTTHTGGNPGQKGSG